MDCVIDTIVDRFRDAAVGLADWAEALGIVAAATGAHVGQLGGISRANAMTVNFISGAGPDQIDAYFEAGGHDPAVNPRTRGLISTAPGLCFTDADMIDPTSRTPPAIYDGLFRQLDVPHAAVIRLDTGKDMTFGIAMMRSRSAGCYARSDTDLLTRAAPGIADAVQVAVALGVTQDRTILDMMETLAGAAILLDKDRRIVSVTAGAEAVLQSGRYLTVASGRLAAANAASDGALERAVAAAMLPAVHKRRKASVPLRSSDDGETLLTDISPLPARLSGPISAAKVLLTIPAPPSHDFEVRRARLMAAFALTAAEADIALQITEGKDVAQIAATRGSSVGTVRSQLKVIFEKTYTRRQLALAVLVQRCC